MEEAGELTPSRFHNPSPCPEFQDEEAMDEFIKDTTYNKRWVYSILLSLLKEVEKHATSESEDIELLNVPDQQQHNLGLLWDICMDINIAKFLMNPAYNTLDILNGAICKSKAPRLLEIAVGILGNLCSHPEVCATITQNETCVSLICGLLSNIEFDAPTVKEAIRLVLTCLSNLTVRERWLQAILNTPDLFALLLFVLQSAVDVDLLRLTGDFIDTLMDIVDELCEQWGSLKLIESIVVAIRQMGDGTKHEVKPFLHIFQLLSTTESGVQNLVAYSKGVMTVLLRWLREVCDEDILVVDDHLRYLTCVISVLNLLFTTDNKVADYLSSNTIVLKDMLIVVQSLYNIYPFRDNPAALPHCVISRRRSSCYMETSASDPQTPCVRTPDNAVTETADSNNRTSDPGSHGYGVKGEGQEVTTMEGEEQEVAATEGEGQDDSKLQSVGYTGSGQEREKICDKATFLYRSLFEVLQEYFRNFFNYLKLDKQPKDKSREKSRDKVTASTAFYPVLRHLDKCPRRHISYMVSALVYNIPTSSGSGEGSEQGETSPEGWHVVHHLKHLCHKLHLKRAVDLLEDVASTVKLTAGMLE